MEKEKSTKPKNKLLKYLPRAATAVSFSFQNPPFSPGRDHHQLRTHHANRGFSGPILIPDEARRKPKNGGYQEEEPTSPKVSCIGQIKQKKNKIMILKSSSKKNNIYVTDNARAIKDTNKNSTKGFSSSRIRRIFGRTPSSVNASGVGNSGERGGKNDDDLKSKVVPKVAAPSLGQMKRFASGRETLGNFDWSAQIAPVEYSSDDERRGIISDGDGQEEEEEEEEVIIPYSAPILMGGGGGVQRPLMSKKEVNLWRRRTIDRPAPLKLK